MDYNGHMRVFAITATLCLMFTGCGNKKGQSSDVSNQTASVDAGQAKPKTLVKIGDKAPVLDPTKTVPLAKMIDPETLQPFGKPGVSGRHRSGLSDWTPAENKKGTKRFKDPGFYYDGVPVGMMRFGELPVPLTPVWREEKLDPSASAKSKRPQKSVRQRHYRFTDYFSAVGLDLKQMKEVHIYGGNQRRSAVIISGAKLLEHKDKFLFRFASEIHGRPIPVCPPLIGDGRCPDQLTAVAIYAKKKPPTRDGADFFLDGKNVDGIPYYGEPLRGGIRIYSDGRLTATIKRRKLEAKELRAPTKDDTIAWKLFTVLDSLGVETSKIQEGWVIHNDLRRQRIPRAELAKATFVASSQGRGEILLGPKKIRTNAIAFHTKPVAKKDLPVFTQREQEVFLPDVE